MGHDRQVDLAVDLSQRTGRTDAIYRALHGALTTGRVPAGERLPSTRDLATRPRGVARDASPPRTSGWSPRASSARGSAPARSSPTARERHADSCRQRRPGALRPRAGWRWTAHAGERRRGRRRPTTSASASPTPSCSRSTPGAGCWPPSCGCGANSPGTYAEPAGHLGLRQAVARYVAARRGRCAPRPDDVVVTNGTQQALDLIARVLLEPGDVVAVEDPGYPPARDLFASLGARVVRCPVDAEGLVVDAAAGPARGSSTSRRRTSSRWACRCRCARRRGAARRGRSGTARRSSRTTTTASSGSPPAAGAAAEPRPPPAGCSTSARSRRRCCPRCGSASSWRRRRCGPPCARRGSSATGTGRSRPRRRWPGSWTRACSPGTSARPLGVYAARHEAIVLDDTGGLADRLELVPSSAGLHVCAADCPADDAGGPRPWSRAPDRRSVAVESLAAYSREVPSRDGIRARLRRGALEHGAGRASSLRRRPLRRLTAAS